MKLSICVFITVFFTFSVIQVANAKEVTIAAGAILKNEHGSVQTTGHVIGLKGDYHKYARNILESGFPDNHKALLSVLKEPTLRNYSLDYGDSKNIKYELAELHRIYHEIKATETAAQQSAAVSDVKNSTRYRKAMEDIAERERLKPLFDQELGPSYEKFKMIDNEKQALTQQQIMLSNQLAEQINALILADNSNGRTLSKSKSQPTYIKFKPSKPDRRTGQCKDGKGRSIFIDRISRDGKCYEWKLAGAWKAYIEPSRQLVEDVVDQALDLNTQLKGENSKDINSINLKHRNAKKALDVAYKEFRKKHGVTQSLTALIRNFKQLEEVKQSWENHITTIQQSSFDPENSARIKTQILDRFTKVMEVYYLSVAEDMKVDVLTSSQPINNHIFETDSAEYFAIFASLNSPMSKHDLGIIVHNDKRSDAIYAKQTRQNTLPFGFSVGYSEKEYLAGVLLYSLDNQ